MAWLGIKLFYVLFIDIKFLYIPTCTEVSRQSHPTINILLEAFSKFPQNVHDTNLTLLHQTQLESFISSKLNSQFATYWTHSVRQQKANTVNETGREKMVSCHSGYQSHRWTDSCGDFEEVKKYYYIQHKKFTHQLS